MTQKSWLASATWTSTKMTTAAAGATDTTGANVSRQYLQVTPASFSDFKPYYNERKTRR